MSIKTSKRIPLKGTFILKMSGIDNEIYRRKITIKQVIGMGATSVCYAVNCDMGDSGIRKMILKQFYPDPYDYELDIEVHQPEVNIKYKDKREDVLKLEKLFMGSYALQNQLADEEELMSVVVRPYEKSFAEKGNYILYEANFGESLDKCQLVDIEEILEMTYKAALALGKLHKKNILHMDLKEENILWVDQKSVKFFDFDSSIDISRREEVDSIRGDKAKYQLIAPELRRNSDIMVIRNHYLKPRVDIYSLAAIMFKLILGRYPEERDCKDFSQASQELQVLFQGEYRGRFTEKEQKFLSFILKKGIHLTERYNDAEKFAEDLKVLINAIGVTKEPKKDYTRANRSMIAAYVLDENPLFEYFKEAREEKSVNVAIVGSSLMRIEFFRHIFACAQTKDTKLKISFYGTDAVEYMKTLKMSFPLLLSTTKIFINGQESRDRELDQVVTKEPLAYLYFYESDSPSKDHQYYLFLEDDCEENYQRARNLQKELSQATKDKVFIGFADSRGDGLDIREKEVEGNITLQPFGCNAKYSIAEKNFNDRVGRLAFAIHQFYTKEWQERIPRKELWKSFIGNNQYNFRSSVRAALAIKYKLASCGCDKSANPARDFYTKVLDSTPEAKNHLTEMLYLEHRSWLCFMILEGYTRPTLAEISRYAYTGNNDHRDTHRKLHPCICSSDPQKGISLDKLSHHEWLNKDSLYEDNLDYLDQMSLFLHRLCEQKVKEIDLEETFRKLKRELNREDIYSDYEESYKWFYSVYKKMLHEEGNGNALWFQCCKEFRKIIVKAYNREIMEAYEEIVSTMKVVEARNEYHDYKSSDLTLIKAIPRLLIEPYYRVIKPLARDRWANLLSTLIVEPKELILLEDRGKEIEESELGKIREFFYKKRGLTELKVIVRKTDSFRTSKRSKKFLFDATGCDRNYTFAGDSDICFYNQKHTITIQEVFSMYGIEIVRTSFEETLGKMRGCYEQLWKVFLANAKKSKWKSIIQFFRNLEEKSSYFLNEFSEEESEYHIDEVNIRLLEDVNITGVLQQLKNSKVIKSYQLSLDMQRLTFVTKAIALREIILKIIHHAQEEPYQHYYRLEKGQGGFRLTNRSKKIIYSQEIIPILSELANLELIKYSVGTKGSEGNCHIKFEQINRAAFQCLLREKDALIAYVYQVVKQDFLVDDIRFNSCVDENIDLLCSKGFNTLYISCCFDKPTCKQLQSIIETKNQYGIHTKAIIIYAGNIGNPEDKLSDVDKELVVIQGVDVFHLRSILRKLISV